MCLLLGCSRNENSDMNWKKIYYQVVDNYNTSKYTLKEQEKIVSGDTFIKSLDGFRGELISSDGIDFYEIGTYAVEFIGPWNKPKDLANGYGHKDLTDQQVVVGNKTLDITPVNAFLISKMTQKKLGWNYFTEKDFLYDDEIPLVLGSGFREYYKIGDSIPFMYLGEDFNGKVVGFLEEDLILDDFLRCNSYSNVLMPYVENIDERNDYRDRQHFVRLYRIFRSQGYVSIKKPGDFDEVKSSIEQLSSKYNLDYTVLRGY